MHKHIALTALSFAVLSSGGALARPFVYVASFGYGGGVIKCLDSAAEALKRNGFTERARRDYDTKVNDKVGRVYASHTDTSTRAVIYCDQKDGVTSLAVAGLDADATWDQYSKLYDAEW